ncbi:MAG: calcium/proton exchanger [Methanotrichaceae archaeon]|nr:calcium/proton exchanger [Methanotrichaceae archaeon]
MDVLSNLIRYLLVFPLLAIIAWVLSFSPPVVFALSILGLIPLASLIGDATEVLAYHAGPKVGSLLNATFGTIVSLILLFALLRSGQTEIVKASIVGSILMSLIVIVGLSQLLGGLKNGIQRFDREMVGIAASMMMLAVTGLLLPTLLGFVHQIEFHKIISTSFQEPALITLSRLIAIILLAIYGLQVIFQFRQPSKVEEEMIEATASIEGSKWSIRQATGLLVAATLGVAIVSEILSGSMEPFGQSMGLSPLFLGLIVLPLAGTFSDILVGVRMALRNDLELSLSIASNSAMQDALFVAPLLALISSLVGQEMTLYFGIFQVLALLLAVSSVIVISSDGVSNWMEGVQLLAFYLMIALWFYFLVPASF